MTMIRYLSVCSGIEAFSHAVHDIPEFVPVGFAEIEPAPCAVLAHHYGSNLPGEPFPSNGVRNYGDFTRIDPKGRSIDLLVGGTPCQVFSTAGLRGGFSDPRGQLTLEYVKLLDRIDDDREKNGLPRAVALWENVPGVLSMPGNEFGHFLAALVGEEESLTPGPKPADGRSNKRWRWDRQEARHVPRWSDAGVATGPKRAVSWVVRDAQFHALAQRRRRVFVVASARDFRSWNVSFEREGVRRVAPPSRKAGKGDAAGAARSADGDRGAIVFQNRGSNVSIDAISGTLGTNADCVFGSAAQVVCAARSAVFAFDLREGAESAICDFMDGVEIRSRGEVAHGPLAFAQSQCSDMGVSGVMGTLNTNANATGRNTPQYAATLVGSREGSGAAMHRASGQEGDADFLVVHAFDARQSDCVQYGDITGPVDTGYPPISVLIGSPAKWIVRRLTPRECERLQGFSDDYTAVPFVYLDKKRYRRTKNMADRPRYKILGNSMAVPVMRWLALRLLNEWNVYTKDWVEDETWEDAA